MEVRGFKNGKYSRKGGGGVDEERGFFLKLQVITAPETLTVEISLPFPSWENFNISKKINWSSLCFFLEPVWKGPRKLDNEGLRVHSDGSVSFIVILREKTKSNNNFVFYLFIRRKRSNRGYRFIHYRTRLKIDLTNNLNRISSIIRVFRSGFVRREFPFNVFQLNNIFVSTKDGKWHNPRTMERNNGQDGSLKGNVAVLAKSRLLPENIDHQTKLWTLDVGQVGLCSQIFFYQTRIFSDLTLSILQLYLHSGPGTG